MRIEQHKKVLNMGVSSRVAIVTGGSRGIGAEIVKLLAHRGLRVACTYRSERRKAAALAAHFGNHVLPVRYELGDEASAEALVSTVLDRWGRVDALVHNAGIWHGGRLAELDPGTWWEVVETNLRGAAVLTRHSLPELAKGTDPSILFVSSAVGSVGFAGDSAYASAKAALTGFARSLAKELGAERIRVNVLAPGFVETDMTSRVSERARTKIINDLVLRRFAMPAEIAKAAVFLLEDATYCTGTVLAADGGWTI